MLKQITKLWRMTRKQQVINFFVGLLFLRMLEQLGSVLLNAIFGFFCVVAVIFVQKNVIETKGKSLQEIEISLLSATQ